MLTDVKLQRFAEFMVIPKRFKEEAKKTADRIFQILQSKSEWSIDRCRIVGGFGKGTSTSVKADVDCVIFINIKPEEKKKLLEDILKEWRRVLEANLGEVTIKPTLKALKVTVKEVSLDILPAVNLATDPQDVVTSQRINTLEYVKRSRKPSSEADRFDSELSESSLQFMKSNTKFVHDIVRLAKTWNSRVGFLGYVAGRSLIMETLAIKAGLCEENNNQVPSHEKAFRDFLNRVKNIRETDIIFFEFYYRNDIPADIMREKPLLLDPTNPYNNLLSMDQHNCPYDSLPMGMPSFKEFLDFIARAAVGTLACLESARSLEGIFCPFLPTSFRSTSRILGHSFLVGVESEAKSLPSHVARGSTPPGFDLILGQLEKVLALYARCREFEAIEAARAAGQPQPDVASLVKKSAEQLIDSYILDRPGNWVPSSDRHESKMFTCEIPLVESAKVLKVSFNLQ